jgi:hypothetical protein
VAVQYKSLVAIGTALTVVGIAVMLAVLGVVTGTVRLAGVVRRRWRTRQEAAIDLFIKELTFTDVSTRTMEGHA